jgi:hypothetical protein
LAAVLFAYRSTEQESTGYSPFELMLGRRVCGPMELLRKYWTQKESEGDGKHVYKYVIDLKQRLQQTCELAQNALRKCQQRQKMYYDRKSKPKSLKVGGKVLLLLSVKSNKLLLQWRGPYTVVKKMSPVNYQIQVGRKVKNFHINMLKPYVEMGRENIGNVTETGNKPKHSITKPVNDNESTSLVDSAHRPVNDFVGDEIIASAVVNDYDDSNEGRGEMIHVCPIGSHETIDQVKVNPKLFP